MIDLMFVLLGWVGVSVPASFALGANIGKGASSIPPAHSGQDASPWDRVETDSGASR